MEIYHLERHVWAWVIGGIFAFLAIALSLHTMYQTFAYNSIPEIRKNIMRVLLMVPIYALEAWLGLLLKEQTFVFDVLRECYEAFVIWSFFSFLIAFLGGEQAVHALLQDKQAEAHHMAPFKWCMRPWSVADGTFYRRTRAGVLQYVPLRLGTAVAALIAQAYGVYGNGEFEPHVAYPWLALITNCSQMWAMYCLVLLYHTTSDYLQPIRPFVKFCCVKLVVFFTFWQSVAIAGLQYVGKLQSTETYSEEDVSAGVQDFLICIEMFAAAVAHIWAFPPMEFHDEATHQPESLKRLGSVLVPTDVIHEVVGLGKHTARELGQGVTGAARDFGHGVSGAADTVVGHARTAIGWGVAQNQRLLERVRSVRLTKVKAPGAGVGPLNADADGNGDGHANGDPLNDSAALNVGAGDSSAAALPPPLVSVVTGDDHDVMRGPAIAGGFDSLPASPANRDLALTASHSAASGSVDAHHGPAVGEWRAL